MHHTCIIWMRNNADKKEDLILTANWTTWVLENNPENIKREKERQPDRELHVLVSQLNYSPVRLTSSMAGHYVQSFQRSGFGSQSSLIFFRFFFHRLGCSVNHIFVYIALNSMQSLVVCGPQTSHKNMSVFNRLYIVNMKFLLWIFWSTIIL